MGPILPRRPSCYPPRMSDNRIAPRAPRPRQDPSVRRLHGFEVVDEYAWLRAPNWKEALHDPARLPPEILAHLRAEAAYCDWMLAALSGLRARLVGEMRDAAEPWLRPPQPFGPWLYALRYGEGEHPLVVRTPRGGGPETVLLDGNALAAGRPFFRLGQWRVSPDHRLLAYAVDLVGSEAYRIRIRDLAAGEDRDEIPDASGSMVWSADARILYHVGLGPDLRPSRVLRHRLGGEAEAIYAEADPTWAVALAPTTSDAFALINVRNSEDGEVHLVDLHAEGPPRLVEPRRRGLSYDVDHRGEDLVVRTNADGAEDYKLVTAPLAAPGRAGWRDLVPHRPGVTILAHRCLARHLVRLEREDAAVRVVVRAHRDGEEHVVRVEEPFFRLRLEPTCAFDTDTIRFTTSTPVRPNETSAYDMARRSRAVVARQESRLDPARYALARLWARAPDGERVPISVVHARDLPRDGTAPCLLHGYGAYGFSMDPAFAVERLPLLERGFVFAIAHVRGGAERGRRWYRDGKLERRENAFSDFVAAAGALIEAGYTGRGRIVAHGFSAGGMLVGAAVNRDPGLFAGVIADMPFVDVLHTMLDDELPLTPGEWLEWGDPIRDPDAFARILSYSPYEQVRPAPYPPVLARAAVSDARVTYWEAAKWIARLRARASGGPFLLAVDFTGHSGNEGRVGRLQDRAREIAFALRCVGLA